MPLVPRFLMLLDDVESPWTNGPYAEAARQLLQQSVHPLRRLVSRCTELADAVRGAGKPWVLTHGQMHGGNIVWTKKGDLLLVDWDCATIAPRERDLGTWANDLDPKTDDDRAAYSAAGEPPELDPTAIELYRNVSLLWTICADTEVFRSPHDDDADARHEWNNLRTALSSLEV